MEEQNLEGLKILIIDDTVDTVELLDFVLTLKKAKVIKAFSAREAVERIKESNNIDAILCDISMPGEDGYSLIKRIRNCCNNKVSSVPAAAVTAYGTKEDILKSIDSGFQMHISKPIDINKLASLIIELTKKKVDNKY